MRRVEQVREKKQVRVRARCVRVSLCFLSRAPRQLLSSRLGAFRCHEEEVRMTRAFSLSSLLVVTDVALVASLSCECGGSLLVGYYCVSLVFVVPRESRKVWEGSTLRRLCYYKNIKTISGPTSRWCPEQRS